MKNTARTRFTATSNDLVVDTQLSRFPGSRYMGSKQAILPDLFRVFSALEFTTALDAFSGSAIVSYLLKTMGKSVTSNDFLNFSFHTANACIANDRTLLLPDEVSSLLLPHHSPGHFIEDTFRGLYFTDQENIWLENVSAHIRDLQDNYKQSIAYAALARACLRKRPRGLFTYTGLRYDDGRKDLRRSLEEQFFNAVDLFNRAVFDNGQLNYSYNSDVFALPQDLSFDLVYIDTPYVSPHSDNDYGRRYHFVEGLTRYWKGLEILYDTSTKKFKRIPSLFDSKNTINTGFSMLFERFAESILVVSYSSNGIPNKEELYEILQRYKRQVEVIEIDHRYSFGTHSHKVGNNQNLVKEYIFVGI